MAVARKVAPEIPADLEWFNTATPLTLTRLRGDLVLLAFIDSSSTDSRRMLHELDRLGYRFRGQLLILYVHLPGLPAEHRCSHVQEFIRRHALRFPLVHDRGNRLGPEYGIRRLPALVLIGRDGRIVGTLTGPRELAGLQVVINHQLSLQRGGPAGAILPEAAVADPEPGRTLRFPGRIALAGDRMYVSDSGHDRVLVLTRQGYVIRQYGGHAGGFVDGIADSAAFRNPQGLMVSDDFLYVADAGNHAIRRINLLTDEVVTVAGNGVADGPLQPQRRYPAHNPMNTPLDVIFSDGRVCIAMAGVDQLWSLSLLTNTVELLAGSGERGQTDGKPGQARFAQPSGLTLYDGTIYCTDALSSAVRRIDAGTGCVGTLAAGGEQEQGTARRPERPVPGVGLQYPQAIAVDGQRQQLWIADSYNNRVCRLDIRTRKLSTLVRNAGLREPAGLAIAHDTLYIANTNAHAIVQINPDKAAIEVLNVSEENSVF